MGNEAQLMPYIDSANIACGYHAGDAATMREVILLCLQYNVHVGAHPSFLDRKNFGRTPMYLPDSEVYDLVTAQLRIIDHIARDCGSQLYHVKPHGALYNMAASNASIAKTLAQAVRDFDPSLLYVGLSGSVVIAEAEKLGLNTASEVFADRTYQPDGSLTPRSQPDALLVDKEKVTEQVLKMVKEGKVRTTSGEEVSIKADTICIHGDGEHAVEFAKAIHNLLHAK